MTAVFSRGIDAVAERMEGTSHGNWTHRRISFPRSRGNEEADILAKVSGHPRFCIEMKRGHSKMARARANPPSAYASGGMIFRRPPRLSPETRSN